jgi:gliding motility-associated-like protein
VYKDIGFYVPKAFTPNGDGTNDIFRPIPVSISSIEYFRIYNRFGNKVFETTNVYMGWDGRFNNNKQNTDTYIYIIKGTTLDGKEVVLKGSFLLIN